jgi:hypothetical protein
MRVVEMMVAWSKKTRNNIKYGWSHMFEQLGESHPRVAAVIKKNSMIVRENFDNLVRLIIRENFSDLGNLVAAVGSS